MYSLLNPSVHAGGFFMVPVQPPFEGDFPFFLLVLDERLFLVKMREQTNKRKRRHCKPRDAAQLDNLQHQTTVVNQFHSNPKQPLRKFPNQQIFSSQSAPCFHKGKLPTLLNKHPKPRANIKSAHWTVNGKWLRHKIKIIYFSYFGRIGRLFFVIYETISHRKTHEFTPRRSNRPD